MWALPEADSYFAPILARDARGFEIDHLDLALAHCGSFRTAVDGGAHIGTWAAAMARRFARVLAFEPARDTFACLVENTQAIANIERIPCALGPTRSMGAIVDDPTRHGNTGARHLRVGDGGECEIVPLDDYQIDVLDFLKLDVEGYELQALVGAVATIERCRPTVMIECKRFKPPRYGAGPEAAVEFLAGQNYREAARARNDRVFVHAD